MKNRIVLVTIAAVLGLAGPLAGSRACAQERPREVQPGRTADLRPKFKKGAQNRFVMVLDSQSSQRVPGNDESSQTIRQEIGLVLRCTDAHPETGTTLELVFESFKVDLTAPTGDVSFDSTKPAKDDDIAEQVFRSIVGLTQQVKVDADGQVTSVSGGDGAGMLAQFTGADMMKNVFGPIFSVKKGKPSAAVGEAWTTEDVIEGPGARTRVRMTHTLKSIAGNNANIDLKGSVILEPASPGSPMPAVKDSSISGEAVWDLESGMLQRLETSQTLSVEQKSAEGVSSTTQRMKMKVTRQR